MVTLPAFGSPPTPPPIDSIHDITGAEKNYLKNQQHSSSYDIKSVQTRIAKN